jgi:hypothetical protein
MGIISNGNTVIDNGAIDAGEVDTTQIANDAVTADKLANTAVTPAEYTSATITVDAQGRITAASSGSGGAGAFVPKIVSKGPSSGTYTANPATNYIGAYMYAGGGGGGGGYTFNPAQTAGAGGPGGFGFYGGTLTQPFSQPYSVGGGGSGGARYTGNGGSGGATSITNFGTVNGGNGGVRVPSGGASGNPGNAPGVNLSTYRGFVVGEASANQQFGTGGPGGVTSPGTPGVDGVLAIFENIGT